MGGTKEAVQSGFDIVEASGKGIKQLRNEQTETSSFIVRQMKY
jgi:hypothetical protein